MSNTTPPTLIPMIAGSPSLDKDVSEDWLCAGLGIGVESAVDPRIFDMGISAAWLIVNPFLAATVTTELKRFPFDTFTTIQLAPIEVALISEAFFPASTMFQGAKLQFAFF